MGYKMENKQNKFNIKDIAKNAPKYAEIAKSAYKFFQALSLLSDSKEYELVEKNKGVENDN